MGQFRTLIRKTRVDEARRSQPENRRVKPGTPRRRIIVDEQVGPFEHTLHATKGHRYVRVAV